MLLAHKIRLRPTLDQEAYFRQAVGTSRKVWNWALDEWNRQYAAGMKPNAYALRKQFNAVKYDLFPWLKEIHRDAHTEPFSNLSAAWTKFFNDLKTGKKTNTPVFKRKGKSRDSFYVANDRLKVKGLVATLPKVGVVVLTENLRFSGKIISGTVSRTANRWFLSIQVEVPDAEALKFRTGNNIVGVDLGIKTAATLSTGESIEGPKPLKKILRRLRIRSRDVSRKLETAKMALNQNQSAYKKGLKLPLSNNRKKYSDTLDRTHARVADIRTDFLHKLTTKLCRENQTVVIEDLNVSGMLKNKRLSRAISDMGFGVFRRQLEYKAKRYGNTLIIADRWFPSSKLCSDCDWKYEELRLKEREWTCLRCGVIHDRDLNAALNLSKLPVASSSERKNVGKVTPVRHEPKPVRNSGQESTVNISVHF